MRDKALKNTVSAPSPCSAVGPVGTINPVVPDNPVEPANPGDPRHSGAFNQKEQLGIFSIGIKFLIHLA